MRKLIYLLIVLAVAALLATACEKDDICPPDSPTTPLLSLGFFDLNEPDTPKSVTRLRVIGIGNGNPVNTFPDRSNRTEVLLPLKTLENSTGFQLINDSADDEGGTETGNSDVITFNYQVNEQFQSRGCGIVSTFSNLEAVYSPDAAPWITSVLVEVNNIQNQDTIHVKILH